MTDGEKMDLSHRRAAGRQLRKKPSSSMKTQNTNP